MKLRILSDLHLEFAPFEPPPRDADVVILAGDTHPGRKGVLWAEATFPGVPVLYLMGNHEFYGHKMPKLTQELQAETAGTDVHVLENSVFEWEDLVFLGSTLWSDFALFGDPSDGAEEAEHEMNDFRRIRTLPCYRKLRARDLMRVHRESVRWLEEQFRFYAGRKIVVITHHAPSAKSLPFNKADDPLSCAYTSNLDPLVEASNSVLWIHGHIHTPMDYTIGNTRVISNPRGYPDATSRHFQPELVVEV